MLQKYANTPQKYANTPKEGCAPARQPISEEVVQFSEQLAHQAQQLAERVNNKLQSVMSVADPRPTEAQCKEKEYPPLFCYLRGNFIVINDALESIEYALSRTEL